MVYGDAALVINQLNKEWNTGEKMDAYVQAIRRLENKFYGIEYHHVIRDNNPRADELSKLGSSRKEVPPGVFVHDLFHASVDKSGNRDDQLIADVEIPADDWRSPFIKYLVDAIVPHDKIETERLVRCSKHYILVDNVLMRKNAKEELLQKCVSTEEGKEILKDIHEGTCGNHAASRTLVGKAF